MNCKHLESEFGDSGRRRQPAQKECPGIVGFPGVECFRCDYAFGRKQKSRNRCDSGIFWWRLLDSNQ